MTTQFYIGPKIHILKDQFIDTRKCRQFWKTLRNWMRSRSKALTVQFRQWLSPVAMKLVTQIKPVCSKSTLSTTFQSPTRRWTRKWRIMQSIASLKPLIRLWRSKLKCESLFETMILEIAGQKCHFIVFGYFHDLFLWLKVKITSILLKFIEIFLQRYHCVNERCCWNNPEENGRKVPPRLALYHGFQLGLLCESSRKAIVSLLNFVSFFLLTIDFSIQIRVADMDVLVFKGWTIAQSGSEVRERSNCPWSHIKLLISLFYCFILE